MRISQEVAAALEAGSGVVALESTIISHGFNYPENLECALACEAAVRTAGATPATIAILDGEICVGLSQDEIERLATEKNIVKASRRDLAYLRAQGATGATTVSATMIAAHMAGIKIFATGGIGGVHRGAGTTFDISADLEELARTPVAVVCAGVKSILDIPLTLEYLETAGVPVIGMQSQAFPAFYLRDSGYKCDYSVDSPTEAGGVLKAHHELRLQSGMLVANPIPAEHEPDPAYINAAIENALRACEHEGIRGKAATPFLLGHLAAHTGGVSVAANKALVVNNARIAAQIATA
jgi:pseudouridine-5'-phosphate glycosidase